MIEPLSGDGRERVCLPILLHHHHHELFEVLAEYYRVDPLRWFEEETAERADSPPAVPSDNQVSEAEAWPMRVSTTKKPEFLSGSSDTRSTTENGDSLPETLSPACHQLWLQGQEVVQRFPLVCFLLISENL